MTDLEKGLRYFIIFAVFTIVLVTPFIFSGSLFFPYVVGKALFFRTLVTLALGAWVLLVFLDRRYLPSFNWVTVALSLFMVWVLIANTLGYSPKDSFWSNFERMEGYINLLSTFALFMVATTVFDSKKLWFRLFNASLVAAFVMGVVALTQYADGASRADGLLGNPIYLAGYMLFHVFLAGFFFLNYIKKSIYPAFFYGALVVFFASLIMVTGTRGAMLGLVAGLLLSTLIVAVRRGERPVVRYSAIGGLAVVFLVGSLFTSVVLVNNYEPIQRMEWAQSLNESIKDMPAVRRFSRISLSEGDAAARFLLWGIAVESIKERPILGVGQENFIHLFNSKYDPKLYEREMWFDRAHNIFLGWGVAGGIPAMLLYIAIYAVAIASLWRIRELDYYIKAIFTGLFVAHAVQSFFVFENIASHIYFVIFVAFVAFVAVDRHEQRKSREPLVLKNTFKWMVLPATAICFSLIVYNFHIKALNANLGIINGMRGIECGLVVTRLPWGEYTAESARQLQGGKCAPFLPEDIRSRFSQGNQYSRDEVTGHFLNVAVDEFLQASQTSPIGRQEAPEILSHQLPRFLNLEMDPGVRDGLFLKAERALIGFIDNEPPQTRPLMFLARLYMNVGMNERATEALERALLTAPQRQHVLIALGQSYNKMEEHQKAHEMLKKAHELEPAFREPRIHYAASFLYLGEDDGFEEVVGPLSEREVIFEEVLLEPLEKMGEHERVIEIREKRISILTEEFEEDPKKPDSRDIENIWLEYRRLVNSYRNSGNSTKAIEVLEEAGERFPQLKDVSAELINSIK